MQTMWRRFRLKLVGKPEAESIIEQLAPVVAAGISLKEAFGVVVQDAGGSGAQLFAEEMYAEISEGVPLWRAAAEMDVYPQYVIAIMRAGELHGRLPEHLTLLAEQLRNDRQFKRELYTASAYPAIILAITGIVGIGVAWFILPRLATAFSQLGVALPLLTQWIVALGIWLQNYGTQVIPLAVGIFLVLFYLAFFFPKTSWIGRTALVYLPVSRVVVRNMEIARFGTTMGTLLNAGISVPEALDAVEYVAFSRAYEKLYASLKREIRDGYGFADAFKRIGRGGDLFPGAVQRLIVSGGRSGSLANATATIGETFTEKTSIATENISTALEPILLVIVWFGVVFVATSVLLPIYSILETF